MSTMNFYPGKPWMDTQGKLIQAHGGSVLYHKGNYYWYGEDKSNYVPGGKNWHNGVRCYRSKDLYAWTDMGTILYPATSPHDTMHPHRIMDRPHVVYNARTKLFVMWVKFAGTNEDPFDWMTQYMGVATSPTMDGPFTMVHTIRPLGVETGDFDLWIDERDGKGYFIADRVHTELLIADLTDDYLNVTGYYSSHCPRLEPPLAREAPCFFKREDSYHLISSGTTGYNPNPTEAMVSTLPHGPYTLQGSFCIDDKNMTSFDCQFSSVFKHPTRYGLYIAIGDRWMAKTSVINGKEEAETSEATYVWLPIRFLDNRPFVEWRDEWSLDEYPIDEGPLPWWKR